MRIRTIAAALVVAAPLLALESPQAAACWGTGYGYTATAAATPVAPRRYGYMSYGYSSPAYYGGYGGYSVALALGRVAVRRAIYRGGGYYGGVRRVGYRGGIGVGRALAVWVGRVGVGRIGRR